MAAKKRAGSGDAAVLAKKAVAAAAARAKAKANSGGAAKAGGPAKASSSPATKPGKRPREDGPADVPAKKQQLTSKEKKEAVRAKKAKLRPNFTTIQEITVMWEKMRPSEVSEEDKRKTATAIMAKVAGRAADLSMSHTASRIIQACAKHGDEKVRKSIATEVKGKMIELAKSSYGNFVVRKLIAAAGKAELQDLLKAFKGRIPELMRHPCGSAVVVDLYGAVSTQQRNIMAAEFYGREFQLFDATEADDVHSLTKRVQSMTATQRKSTLQHLTIQLTPIMEKGLVDSELVHRLLAEYIDNASQVTMDEVIDNLSGPFLMRMVHTREGARASCAILRAATAKDRKKIIKAMKDHVKSLAEDEYGHLVLITALSVVDDTALLRKSIVVPLQAMMDELVDHKYGKRVLLQLLAPFNSRYLHVEFHPWVRQITDDDAAGDKASTSYKVTSLKNPDVRRKEILSSGGSDSLAARLVAVVGDNVSTLIRSFTACDCVVEVARGGEGGALIDTCSKGIGRVHTELVSLAAATKDSGEEEDEHVLINYVASRALRRLILSGSKEEGLARAFSKALWGGALSGRCKGWFGTHADKVLGALLECGEKEVEAAASKELTSLVGKAKGGVKAWAESHGLHKPTGK